MSAIRISSPVVVVASLLVIFVLPMVLAGYFYQQHFSMTGTVNQGKLLNPPLSLQQLGINNQKINTYRGHWVLLYVSPQCDKICEQNLSQMQNVIIALGKNRQRVMSGQVILSSAALPPEGAGIYMADPLGNVMMYYQKDSPPKGLLKDLTRLLRVSQIG